MKSMLALFSERLRRSWLLLGSMSVLLRDGSALAWWPWMEPSIPEEPLPLTFNFTVHLGEEAGREWLEGAMAWESDLLATEEGNIITANAITGTIKNSRSSDKYQTMTTTGVQTTSGRRSPATPPRWDSSSCMDTWGLPELQTEADPNGYLLFSEGREQLGNNRFLLSDGLVIARALNRTLVEYPMQNSRIATPHAALGSCDYWDCESLCSYHRILDMQAFRSMLREGVISVADFLMVLFADKEQMLLPSLVTAENVTDFFEEYNEWQVIAMKMAWKSGLRREPMDLLRPNPFYLDLVGRLIEAQEEWRGGKFMAVQWRTETSTGNNLTRCYESHVRPSVEERRKALGLEKRRVFFNTDLVGQASTTYNASVVYANRGVVEKIREDYPAGMENAVYDLLENEEDAGVKAMISGMISASAGFLLSSSFNGSGSDECQKPHSKYIDLVAEWRLQVVGKNLSSIGRMLPGLEQAGGGESPAGLFLFVGSIVVVVLVWAEVYCSLTESGVSESHRSKKRT